MITLGLFSCFSHKTYLWSHRRDLGWRRSPFWILTHLFTRNFCPTKGKTWIICDSIYDLSRTRNFFLCFTYGRVYDWASWTSQMFRQKVPNNYLKSFNIPNSQTVLWSNISKKYWLTILFSNHDFWKSFYLKNLSRFYLFLALNKHNM